ncbi:hypothetical protein GT043_09970, partial [Streptomyces sp. SID2131]|nr:hypothetical protein [Streptomyces sp. SID2131]
MHGWVNGVGSWLSSLDEDALGSLLTWHECLRSDKHVHTADRPSRPSPPSRRELLVARVRLAKAQQGQLTSIASCGLVWAVKALHTEYGFSHRALAAPSLDELLVMLTVLDPPLARCALYGMLLPGMGKLSVGLLAKEHEAALQAAADAAPPPDARAAGPRFEAEEGSADTTEDLAGTGSGAVDTDSPMTDPECEDTVPVAGPEPLEDSAASLALLQEDGERLAVVLRAAADAVETGLLPTDAPGDGLAAWTAERERLAAVFGAEGLPWDADLGYADVGAGLARLREARAEQIEGLRRKTSRYAELLEWADEEEAADLRRHLDRAETQLRELGASTQDPDREPAGGPTGEESRGGTEAPTTEEPAEPPAGRTEYGTGDTNTASGRARVGASAIEAVRRAVEPPEPARLLIPKSLPAPVTPPAQVAPTVIPDPAPAPAAVRTPAVPAQAP